MKFSISVFKMSKENCCLIDRPRDKELPVIIRIGALVSCLKTTFPINLGARGPLLVSCAGILIVLGWKFRHGSGPRQYLGRDRFVYAVERG